MSGTTCCFSLTSWTTPHSPAATFPTAILCFHQESNSRCRKRSQESSSLGSPTAKAKTCCLVSRHSLSVEQDYSSNPERPETTRDSQVWTCEERSAKSGWNSVQHAKGNWQYGLEDSGGPLRNACLGKPRVHAKSRSEHERPTHTRWKQLGNINELREDAHLDMD